MFRVRVPAVALGLLVLAAVAYVAWPRGNEDPVPDGVRDALEAHAEAPRLEGRGLPSPAEAGPTATRDDDPADRTAPAGPILLRGNVRVEEGATAGGIELSAAIERIEGTAVDAFGRARTEIDGPGPFALEITDLVRELREVDARPGIVLTARARGCVDAHATLALPPVEQLLTGRTRLDPVTLVLRRAAYVEGLVLDESRQPRAKANVSLHPIGSDGPEAKPVAVALSDAEGRFRLAAAGSGRHLLVATWQDNDRPGGEMRARPLPASVLVDLEVGRRIDGLVLELGASHRVRGIVRIDGRPRHHAVVGWRPAGDARRLRARSGSAYGRAPLLYVDGAVHWGEYDVRTSDNGRFLILGLSAVPYRLHVDSAPGLHVHRMSKAPVALEVIPPADRVELDLQGARLVMRVRVDGEPAQLEEEIHLCGIGMHPDLPDGVVWGSYFGEADANGVCRIGLTPRHRYVVCVEESDYEPYWHEFEAPAAGEELVLVVDLVPARPKPRLVVTLDGEGAEAVEKASFGFRPVTEDPLSDSAYPVRSVRTEDGRYVLMDLIPGRYRMHVRPGRNWYDVPTDWLEAETEIVIPPEGETRVSVTIEQGGRLQLEIVDVDARYLEGSCVIRDEGGGRVPSQFVVRTETGVLVMSNELPGLGPTWVEPALREGTYEVLVMVDGYERETRRVVVHCGRPTTLRITLRRP